MSNIKRVVVSVGLALVLAVAVGATALAGGNKEHKLALCHLASNARVVEISVAMPAMQAHMAHGDFLVDEYGECVDEYGETP